jgi:capsular polysaccharide export protein
VSASISDCIDVADEVHVMSSLVGMEALMRKTNVVCYGSPFYAGWGLTTDNQSIPSRNKSLSIEELFYCAYVRYPKYFNYNTGLHTTLVNTIENIKNAPINKSKSTIINLFNKLINKK